MKEKVKLWQETELSGELAKLVIYEAFLDKKLKVPRFLLPVVHDYYFKPHHEAFAERNLWSLSNAFTSAFKKLKPVQQFAATAKLGAYLEPVASKAAGANVLEFPVSRMGEQSTVLNQTNPVNGSEIEDLTDSYDPDEFADEFTDYDWEIEERFQDDYENEDFDEEDDLTEEFMRKAA